MSGVDPECHPQFDFDERKVCALCFEDDDLIDRIEAAAGERGCDFCGKQDAPTAPFSEVVEHIQARISLFYGRAVEQLPYDGREGGYQAWNVDTSDLIREEVGLELPRDTGDELHEAIVDAIGDDAWCEYDWLTLEPDESMKSSWDQFCEVVKHSRRFFFHNAGEPESLHPDERTPAQFFAELAKQVEGTELIVSEPAGYALYRARIREKGELFETAAALGPPPAEFATQSNRMNPPGIPMFYGADNAELATAETRGKAVSVGKFATTRETRILDLASMPAVPGFFSEASREERYALSFLHDFAKVIIQPVARDNRTHIDYIPTQVFTEYLRDYPFDDGKIDGVRYRSATGEAGTNVVMFATQANLAGGAADDEFEEDDVAWLKLISVEHIDDDDAL